MAMRCTKPAESLLDAGGLDTHGNLCYLDLASGGTRSKPQPKLAGHTVELKTELPPGGRNIPDIDIDDSESFENSYKFERRNALPSHRIKRSISSSLDYKKHSHRVSRYFGNQITLEHLNESGQVQEIASEPVYAGRIFGVFLPLIIKKMSSECLSCVRKETTRIGLSVVFTQLSSLLSKCILTEKKYERGRLREVATLKSDAQVIINEIKGGIVNKKAQLGKSIASDAGADESKLSVADIPGAQLALWMPMIARSAVKPLEEMIPEQYRGSIQDMVDCADTLASIGPVTRGRPESITHYTELCLKYLELVNGLGILAPSGEVDLLGRAYEIRQKQQSAAKTASSLLSAPAAASAACANQQLSSTMVQVVKDSCRKCQLFKCTLDILNDIPHRVGGNPCASEILTAAMTAYEVQATSEQLEQLKDLIAQTSRLKSNLDAVVPVRESGTKEMPKQSSDTDIKKNVFDPQLLVHVAAELFQADQIRKEIADFTGALTASAL